MKYLLELGIWMLRSSLDPSQRLVSIINYLLLIIKISIWNLVRFIYKSLPLKMLIPICYLIFFDYFPGLLLKFSWCFNQQSSKSICGIFFMGRFFKMEERIPSNKTIMMGIDSDEGIEEIIEGWLIEPVAIIDKILFNTLWLVRRFRLFFLLFKSFKKFSLKVFRLNLDYFGFLHLETPSIRKTVWKIAQVPATLPRSWCVMPTFLRGSKWLLEAPRWPLQHHLIFTAL